MSFSRWDAVAVNYPFLEGDTGRRRPGPVVSSDRLRAAHGLYAIAMITRRAGTLSPKDRDATAALVKAFLP